MLLSAILVCTLLAFGGCTSGSEPTSLFHVTAIAGSGGEFGEPFGLAAREGDVYVSDGENGKILKIAVDGLVTGFAAGLDTPSGIAFDEGGNLIVADPGSNTIKIVSTKGEVRTLAGIEGQRGNTDGENGAALFNGPIGVAVGRGGKIFVSDTYNDRIRLIDNGMVSTLAGSSPGYRDGHGTHAQFDTPLGITIWNDKLMVADAGNRRIRVVEPDGTVWTLAGTGEMTSRDGPLYDSGFVRPTAVAVDEHGRIFVADGNSIRAIGSRVFPFVETITDTRRGFRDGPILAAQFNRPSGIAFHTNGILLVADSENRVVRKLSSEKTNPPDAKGTPVPLTAEEFRALQPGRWPFEPPEAGRDVAGTLGEIRGEMKAENPRVWFHNGLDIAGQYGETAYFIRNEKVLDPLAVDNLGTSRELIRLPTLGYIHLRLGRDKDDGPFGDPRFQFIKDEDGTIDDLRVPRGTKFIAGERVGTLNSMNHVHLIAGPSGSEMNALAALTLPNVSDTIAPTVEKVSIFDSEWNPIETPSTDSRINLAGKFRIVARAFDRMDGNPERRKLGVYRLGYQIFYEGSPSSDLKWTIEFDRMPPNEAVKFVYANGSVSGPTGETIFDYIVTNQLTKDSIGEDFIDASMLEPGNYTIRVFAADLFGNNTTRDINFEVTR